MIDEFPVLDYFTSVVFLSGHMLLLLACMYAYTRCVMSDDKPYNN